MTCQSNPAIKTHDVGKFKPFRPQTCERSHQLHISRNPTKNCALLRPHRRNQRPITELVGTATQQALSKGLRKSVAATDSGVLPPPRVDLKRSGET
ncbi:hypothetical protein CCHOA_10105 [Corynebacterium choanae]|uniref:Uncharacterized protein n=1 Tax=Corynebacterium choanae TaxID=1862358 RepID=A0A3G6JE40_9CORY|nr:hypothetical protein CCHOA_10105 [Corynebacterium choanae]